jgi:drug/metabolite transporter (DMT)-like permease
MVNLSALFQAMVVGTISIVAPISATGVVVPIAVGIARGEYPGAAQVAGIVVAVVGIVLTTSPSRGTQPDRRQSALVVPVEPGLALALVAALGGGLFFWLMAPASRQGVAWAVLIARLVPVCVMAATLVVRRASLRQVFEREAVRGIVTSALLAFSGIVLYAFSTLHGQLAIVSVLASLYPAMTVLLAHRLLGEQIHRNQRCGICAVLLGIVLMSTG